MQIVMPKLGLTMTEATLTRWVKNVGERVQQDEILFEFESDKSLMEYECPADGILTEILVPEGETVDCGTPLAILETMGQPQPAGKKAEEQRSQEAREQVASPATGSLPSSPQIANKQSPTTNYQSATPAAKRRARELGVNLAEINGRGPQGRIHMADVEDAQQKAPAITATPVAKRMASELAVDLAQISGSGPGGRVVKEDVLQATQSQAEPAAPSDIYRDVQPLSGVRGVIARRMSESAFSAPHVTLFTEVDASALVEARTQLNTELGGTVKISYNTLLVAIVSRALQDHPPLNACLVDDEIRQYRDINIALAVDTERGLLVPVIRNTERLDLVTIQQTGEALIERALAGKSLPDDLTGGTFTITNLGMFDVDGFTPIINQPQAAILGVGRIVAKPVAVDNQVSIRQMVTLSLSFDHRLVDGGPAARFLQRVKQLTERPFALLLPMSR